MHKIKRDAIKAFHELFKFYNTLFIIQKEKRKRKLVLKTPFRKYLPRDNVIVIVGIAKIFIAILCAKCL